MSAKPTHYKILKVAETATPEEIKTAWRDLAKKYHPDRNKGKKAAARIKDVNIAYHELIDPVRRFNYDATLRVERAAEAAAQAAASAAPSSFTDPDDDSTVPPSGQGAPPQSPPPPASGQPPSTTTVQPTWTAADAFLAVGQLVWSRVRPFAIVALIGIAAGAVGVLLLIAFALSRGTGPSSTMAATDGPAGAVPQTQHETTTSTLAPVSQTPVDPRPSVTVRLEPRAYSYAARSWANFDSTSSSGYPNVYGLGFHNQFGWGAGMSWTGSHSITGDRISLSVENLKLPKGIEEMVARQWGQLNWWSDVGVGYHVELRGALFEDHSMAKDLFVFRTFLGDTPPARVEKSFQIIPVTSGEAPLVHLGGEWKGTYALNGDRVPFVMRIEQEGDEISGAVMEASASGPRRSSIHGRVEGPTVTFLKRYGDGSGAVSYVSTAADSRRLEGIWQTGLDQGRWQAEWSADFTDSVEDLPTMISQGDIPSRETSEPKNQGDESWRLRPIDRERMENPLPKRR